MTNEAAKFAVWEERYNLGIEIVDKQHRYLVSIINELFEACKKSKDEANMAFRSSIKEITDYIKNHFKTEEDIFVKYQYPNYRIHKQQHEQFILKTIEYVKDFESGKLYVPNNFVRYLKDWLLEHIAVSDKEYEKYFASKGIVVSVS